MELRDVATCMEFYGKIRKYGGLLGNFDPTILNMSADSAKDLKKNIADYRAFVPPEVQDSVQIRGVLMDSLDAECDRIIAKGGISSS